MIAFLILWTLLIAWILIKEVGEMSQRVSTLTFVANGQLPPLQLKGPFNILADGVTGPGTGTVTLQRAFSGANGQPGTFYNVTDANLNPTTWVLSAPSPVLNTPWREDEAGVWYQLVLTNFAGTSVTLRLSQ